MSARDDLLRAGFATMDQVGFDAATVAAICRAAGVSNGSFFHAFASKDALAAELFMTALEAYHAAMLSPLTPGLGAADGIEALVSAHLTWVTGARAQARFMFERSRAEWMVHIRARQQAENRRYGEAIGAWRDPLIASGHLRDLSPMVFMAQIIGPAQILCRAWLSGRDDADPRDQQSVLADCARRALMAAPL
ncbi:TetR/AcrR family transcriptional regulator [Phenylobacterium aquaticum]|uniref:TetR/AcrR family transcriptional regulator n=1 Tax=Phenylobacterium aquaticum TaxID=1763816 RepID=UPI001F5DD22D|nr:TetR/AcrR family transcriptional regulator [Phenylobacterium aquaticum]MCI3131647.1 TetR/AcrR family transcriptional regulator [Phenylobacterium aquaticum]